MAEAPPWPRPTQTWRSRVSCVRTKPDSTTATASPTRSPASSGNRCSVRATTSRRQISPCYSGDVPLNVDSGERGRAGRSASKAAPHAASGRPWCPAAPTLIRCRASWQRTRPTVLSSTPTVSAPTRACHAATNRCIIRLASTSGLGAHERNRVVLGAAEARLLRHLPPDGRETPATLRGRGRRST